MSLNDTVIDKFIKTVANAPPIPDRVKMPGFITVSGIPTMLITVDKSDLVKTFWMCVPKDSFKGLTIGQILDVMEVVDTVKRRLKELRPDWTVQ